MFASVRVEYSRINISSLEVQSCRTSLRNVDFLVSYFIPNDKKNIFITYVSNQSSNNKNHVAIIHVSQ